MNRKIKMLVTSICTIAAVSSLALIKDSHCQIVDGWTDEELVGSAAVSLTGPTQDDYSNVYAILEEKGLMDDAYEIAAIIESEGFEASEKALEAKFGHSTSSSSTASTSGSSKSKAKHAVTKTTWDSSKTYVVLSKKAVYSTYESSREEIGYEYKGNEVEILGETSNGFYFYNYTNEAGETVEGYLLFEDKDNIVDQETYEAAWDITETVDATCTEDGYELYTNPLSGLTSKTTIEATGHTLGDEELTKEATFFNEGIISTHCADCDEIIETRIVKSGVEENKNLLIGCGAALFTVIALMTLMLVVSSKNNKKKVLQVSDSI